jgi:hypothetical protein
MILDLMMPKLGGLMSSNIWTHSLLCLLSRSLFFKFRNRRRGA